MFPKKTEVSYGTDSSKAIIKKKLVSKNIKEHYIVVWGLQLCHKKSHKIKQEKYF